MAFGIKRHSVVASAAPNRITPYNPIALRSDGAAPIQNKVGAFLTDPALSRIVTGSEKDLQIRRIMDQGKVLLVNLPDRRGQLFPAWWSSGHDHWARGVQPSRHCTRAKAR